MTSMTNLVPAPLLEYVCYHIVKIAWDTLSVYAFRPEAIHQALSSDFGPSMKRAYIHTSSSGNLSVSSISKADIQRLIVNSTDIRLVVLDEAYVDLFFVTDQVSGDGQVT